MTETEQRILEFIHEWAADLGSDWTGGEVINFAALMHDTDGETFGDVVRSYLAERRKGT